MTEPLLACRGLALAVAGRELCAGLNCDVRAGECWVIVGPNGAGKTSLLVTLAGLRSPAAGTIRYGGTPLDQLRAGDRAQRRSYLEQDSVDFFPATVLETVLVGRHPYLGRWQWEAPDDVTRARRALAAMGLAGLEDRPTTSLSGGERRRVALAALLVQDADLLLLDEPSSHLDLAHRVAVLDVLAGLARDQGKAIVMVLHDLHLALRYADHAITLGGGRVQAGTATERLSADALSALFGHPLVEVGTGRARTMVPE